MGAGTGSVIGAFSRFSARCNDGTLADVQAIADPAVRIFTGAGVLEDKQT